MPEDLLTLLAAVAGQMGINESGCIGRLVFCAAKGNADVTVKAVSDPSMD